MRLTEIWDPSMYRSGDERNPQSPYYDGREVDPEDDEYPTQFTWYHYNEQDDEITMVIAGVVTLTTEYEDYFPSRSRRYHEDDDGPEGTTGVSRITIKQVKVGETTMSGKQAEQQFGANLFAGYESELTESAVEGIVSKWGKPTVTNWKMKTEIVLL